jgi:hypothetical protein
MMPLTLFWKFANSVNSDSDNKQFRYNISPVNRNFKLGKEAKVNEWIIGFIGLVSSIFTIFTFFGISSFDEFLKSPIEKIVSITVGVLIVSVVSFYRTGLKSF